MSAALGLISMAEGAQTAPATTITVSENLSPQSDITAEAGDLNAADVQDISEIMGGLVNELDPNPDPRNSIFRVRHARNFRDFYKMAKPSSKKRRDDVLGSGVVWRSPFVQGQDGRERVGVQGHFQNQAAG